MASVVIEPSVFIGDANCPHCGQLLWFIQTANTAQIFDARQSQERKDQTLDVLSRQLGVDRDKITNNSALFELAGADSLDVVELVMELEGEFDLPST